MNKLITILRELNHTHGNLCGSDFQGKVCEPCNLYEECFSYDKINKLIDELEHASTKKEN